MSSVNIDIRELIEEFDFSKDEIKSLRELIAKTYVEAAYTRIQELAQNQLGGTRKAYLEGLQIVRDSQFTYSIKLNGMIPNMLEQGTPPFDMKIGFALSSKVKYTGHGWYLTIPLLFRTTAAKSNSGYPGTIMPRTIYNLIRAEKVRKVVGNNEISILPASKVPERYAPKPKSVINLLNNKAEQYIPKNSIFAGMVRTKDVSTGKSGYNTFRRVSNNSDPNSWIHPGINAYNFMDKALQDIDKQDIVDTAIDLLTNE